MKFLERLALIIYSYIMLALAILACLLVFNWIDINTISNVIENVLKGQVSANIVLATSVVIILLSIKCIFFDSSYQQKLKATQGVLLKNESGKLMISKETINNLVKTVVKNFESIKDCNTKIDLDSTNQLIITLFLVVNENVIIKELATNLQNKIKEEVKNTSDLDVKEVNIKIINLENEEKEIKE